MPIFKEMAIVITREDPEIQLLRTEGMSGRGSKYEALITIVSFHARGNFTFVDSRKLYLPVLTEEVILKCACF